MSSKRSNLSHTVHKFVVYSSLLVLFYLSSCFRIPERPTWNMPFTIPFAERVYSLSDLLDVRADSLTDTALSSIRQKEDKGFYGLRDTLVFYSGGKIAPQSFRDKLHSQSAVNKVFYYTLTSLRLDPVSCGDASFSATTMVPNQYISPNNPGGNIPRLTFDTTRSVDTRGSLFDYFELADTTTSKIYVRIQNNYTIPIDSVSIEIRDTTAARTLVGATTVNPSIAPAHTDTLVFHFPRLPRIWNRMNIRLKGVIHSNTGVTIYNYHGLQMSIFTSTLYVSEGRAAFPRQIARANDTLATDVNDKIISGEIRPTNPPNTTYQLHVTINNSQSFGAGIDSLRVKFPDFTNVNPNYDTVTALYTNILPRTTKNDSVSLDYNKLLLRDTSALAQRFRVSGTCYTHDYYNDPAHQQVTLHASDSLDFNYQLNTVYFSRFTGIPDSITIDFDPSYTKMSDRPEGVTDLGLIYAELVVTPTSNNTGIIPALMDYHIAAWRSGAARDSVSYFMQNQYFRSINTSSRIPNMQGIINIIPDTIKSYGQAKLGTHFLRNMPIISVAESDSVSGYGTLEGKMMFHLQPQQMIPDPDSSNGTDRPISKIEIAIVGENHLPVGGRVRIQISTDKNDSTKWREIGGANVGRPTITNYRPAPPTPFTSFDTTIVVPDSLVDYFKLPKFYTRSILNLTGTGTDTVLCKTTDYIRLRTSARLTINTAEVQ